MPGGAEIGAAVVEPPYAPGPDLLADLDVASPAWKDEIFGPVAPVMKFSTVEESVALANGNEYGLSIGILGDVGLAMTIADQLDSDHANMESFTEIQWLTVRPDIAPYPF